MSTAQSAVLTRSDARGRRAHGVLAERIVLWAIGAGAALVVLTTLTGAPWPIPLVPLVAHLSGMLAGYGAAVVILLVSRAPFLEHRVGADRLTRWHARGGKATLMLVLVHAVFAVFAVAEAAQVSGAAAVGIVVGLPDLLAATAGTIMMIAAGALSARAARKRLRYETWHTIHLVMYVGVALAFAHQIAGPDLAGRPMHQIAWTALYTVSFALLLRYRFIAPLLTALHHDLRVRRVVAEGPGVTTVIVQGNDLDALKAESGQFFRWRFLTGKTWMAAHPFSLSAPPTSDTLRLTVKDAGDGTRVLKTLKPGTRVLAEGPYGAMTAGRRNGSGVLLIAGGIGITPMRALLESLTAPGEPLTLLYRSSSESDLVFRTELDAIAEHRGATIHYVLGRSDDPSTQLSVQRLRQLAPGLDERDIYICASPRFSASIQQLLREAHVPRQRIHQEEFVF